MNIPDFLSPDNTWAWVTVNTGKKKKKKYFTLVGEGITVLVLCFSKAGTEQLIYHLLSSLTKVDVFLAL